MDPHRRAELRSGRQHVRRGMVAVGDFADVEEACAGDVRGEKLPRRIALVGRHERRGIDDREIIRAKIARQPVGGHQIVHG